MKHPKILVVDDDDRIRNLLKMVLEHDDVYKVTTVCNGMDAISLLKRDDYDLMLLDINMPGIDGFEVLKIMKETPDMAETPVIMLTGSSDEESLKRSLFWCTEGYITKPAPINEIRRRIAGVLARRME